MRLWAIVPAKPLKRAKMRLDGVLDPGERMGLAQAMLERTLRKLREVRSVTTTLVISRDRRLLGLAREHGAEALLERGRGGLNAALRQATREAVHSAVDALLVLPLDLARLEPADIETLVRRCVEPPVVVLAPDRFRQGTNAVLASPPGLIEYQFGPSSFLLHVARARAAGARVEICETPGLSLDVDGPEDLELALQAARSPQE